MGKQQLQKQILDPNYFISQSLIEDCREVIQNINEKKRLSELDEQHQYPQVTLLERESYDLAVKLLVEVAERIKLCRSKATHYWVIENYLKPEKAHCYWCKLSLRKYSEKERRKVGI